MRRIFYERRRAWLIPLIPVAIAAFLGLAGLVVMNLWNWLMPVIFHLGMITFWQAVGIFILSKILFGFGRGGRRRDKSWMRPNMEERFKNLTPEEKERFKEKMRRHGCNWDRYGDGSRHPFDTNLENDAPTAGKAE